MTENTINVKHGKNVFKIEKTDSLLVLKSILYSLTKVLPEKQKLMFKGIFIKYSLQVLLFYSLQVLLFYSLKVLLSYSLYLYH
jgi:hypothetical protein